MRAIQPRPAPTTGKPSNPEGENTKRWTSTAYPSVCRNVAISARAPGRFPAAGFPVGRGQPPDQVDRAGGRGLCGHLCFLPTGPFAG